MLSDFVSSFFEHNHHQRKRKALWVVNCFQILYLRSLNTITTMIWRTGLLLWIAFRFCIFVLWTQFSGYQFIGNLSCELLSDFVSSFFEHNSRKVADYLHQVVNCFQILYLRSLNTITGRGKIILRLLWIAFRFCIFVLWTQYLKHI